MTFSSIFSILSHSPDQFFQLVNESLLDLNGNIWKKKKDSFFWVDEWNLVLEYVVLTLRLGNHWFQGFYHLIDLT